MLQLAKAYASAGHQPVILASQLGPRGELLRASESLDGFEVHRFRGASKVQYWLGTGYRREIASARHSAAALHSKSPVNIALVRGILAGLGAREALKEVPVHYIIPAVARREHRTGGDQGLAGTFTARFLRMRQLCYCIPMMERLQRRLVSEADRLWVFSRRMERQVLSFVPGCGGKLGRVHPGVDPEQFRPVADKQMIRRELSLGGSDPILLGVGRIVFVKGFDLAIRALAIIGPDLPCRLVLVGDGPELAALQDLAKRLLPAGKVTFTGARNDVNRFYAAGDVFLMTSRYEAFGQTILEALATALPVIAFRQGGREDVETAAQEIIHRPFGVSCDCTPEGLADAIRRLLARPAKERAQIGAEGRRHVLASYNWAECARTIVGLF